MKKPVSKPVAAPCIDMVKHIFLTGEKRVGKSTIIQLLLAEKQVKAGGFLTIKTDAVFPGCSSLHLIRVGQEESPSEENLIFRNLLGADPLCAERFDALGCAAIAQSQNVDLILMDELGPRELEAKSFTACIMQVLDGDVPVIGVVQKADSPFLAKIKEHPKVQMVPITSENRESVFRQLLQGKI